MSDRSDGAETATPDRARMIPVGYMAKRVSGRPDWLGAPNVRDIYSVSGCVSRDFADFIDYWRHNGYWLFDEPAIIEQLARDNAIDLRATSLFYYEVYDEEYCDEDGLWRAFGPEPSFVTSVVVPPAKRLEGYDIATFCAGSGPECSPLSCNSLAARIETNDHCLLESLELARSLLERGQLRDSEPGPRRIFAVYSVRDPAWNESGG